MSEVAAAGGVQPGFPPQSPRAKLMEAAHQLEAVFYGQLFQAMRATIPDGGLVQQGSGEKMFSGMLDDEVARLATRQTDRGLAAAIYRDLSRRLPPEAPAGVSVAASTEPKNAATRQN